MVSASQEEVQEAKPNDIHIPGDRSLQERTGSEASYITRNFVIELPAKSRALK